MRELETPGRKIPDIQTKTLYIHFLCPQSPLLFNVVLAVCRGSERTMGYPT